MHGPGLRHIAHGLDTSGNRFYVIVISNITMPSLCLHQMRCLSDLASVIGGPPIKRFLRIVADLPVLIIFRLPLFTQHRRIKCEHRRVLIAESLPGSGICFKDLNCGMVIFHDRPLHLPCFQNGDLHITGSHISRLRRRPRLPQDIIARLNMINPVGLRRL